MEENFKKSIDSIKPDDGARDRMLRRIRKKAMSPEKKETTPFRKAAVFAYAALAVFVVLLAFNMGRLMETIKPQPIPLPGPESSPTSEPIPTMPDIIGNPFYEDVAGPEVWKERLSIDVKLPESFEECVYSIYNKNVAEMNFFYKDTLLYMRVIVGDMFPEFEADGMGQIYELNLKNNKDIEGWYVLYTSEEEGVTPGQISFRLNGYAYTICDHYFASEKKLSELAELVIELNK